MDMNGNGIFYNNTALTAGALGNPMGNSIGYPMEYDTVSDMDTPAVNGYAGLTEAQKEEIILHCKDVKTRKQMQEVVDSMVPGMDIQEVFEEERDIFM